MDQIFGKKAHSEGIHDYFCVLNNNHSFFTGSPFGSSFCFLLYLPINLLAFSFQFFSLSQELFFELKAFLSRFHWQAQLIQKCLELLCFNVVIGSSEEIFNV